jgi:hypothetical protein
MLRVYQSDRTRKEAEFNESDMHDILGRRQDDAAESDEDNDDVIHVVRDWELNFDSPIADGFPMNTATASTVASSSFNPFFVGERVGGNDELKLLYNEQV